MHPSAGARPPGGQAGPHFTVTAPWHPTKLPQLFPSLPLSFHLLQVTLWIGVREGETMFCGGRLWPEEFSPGAQ